MRSKHRDPLTIAFAVFLYLAGCIICMGGALSVMKNIIFSDSAVLSVLVIILGISIAAMGMLLGGEDLISDKQFDNFRRRRSHH